MNTTSDLAKTLKSTAAAIAAGMSAKWTGATYLRTVSAEETGLDYDVELLYFQMDLDGKGDLIWVSEDELDELEDADMKEYLV